MVQRKQKGLNKRIEEIKHGTLYMAERLGTERLLRSVFHKFESLITNASVLSEQEIRNLLYKVAVSENAHNELKQAIGYFDQLPKKRPNEQETRAGLLQHARNIGVPEQQLQAIFDKTDNLLRQAANEEQRQHIAYTGAVEVHRLLDNRKALVMDGKLIVPAEPGLEEDDGNFKKVD